jgi:hypothetical protein
MSDAHGGGGGGQYNFIFFIIAALGVLWFYGEVQKRQNLALTPTTTPAVSTPVAPPIEAGVQPATVVEAVREEVSEKTLKSHGEHGTTYYLNRHGDIVDVVRF